MCGRYGFTFENEKDILNRFEIEADTLTFTLHQNYNSAPSQHMPVIERHSPNSLHLRTWGIQPVWSKMLLINAKAENLDTSKVWRTAFRESRCIIPASYFFEWMKIPDGKQPYLIRLKSNEIFGFAGLTVTYHDTEKKEQIGYVIITTEPNDLMKKIHNRMPVILRKEDEDGWLNPDNTEPELLRQLLIPYNAADMEAYPVSTLVNSPKNNEAEVTIPVKL